MAHNLRPISGLKEQHDVGLNYLLLAIIMIGHRTCTYTSITTEEDLYKLSAFVLILLLCNVHFFFIMKYVKIKYNNTQLMTTTFFNINWTSN